MWSRLPAFDPYPTSGGHGATGRKSRLRPFHRQVIEWVHHRQQCAGQILDRFGDDSTFTNVFTVKDWILFQQANVSVGDTFTFTLNGPVPDSSQEYYTCMVWPYNMPSVSNNVTNIQLVK
ncbi:MAG TPA: hypothetical protein VHW43_10230 [Puia sp.]|nr:hypothetical protein [Puia sp.]